MYQDYKDLLSAFQFHGVKYLVVGGFAVIHHSQPRFTKDMDLFIQADTANAKAIYAALAEFGAPLEGIRPEELHRPQQLLSFGRDPKGLATVFGDTPENWLARQAQYDLARVPRSRLKLKRLNFG
jgi:hypothetical protein